MEVAVLLAKFFFFFLVPLATVESGSAINGAIQRKMLTRGVVSARKGITLVISNEDIDDNIRILKSLKYSITYYLIELVKQ